MIVKVAEIVGVTLGSRREGRGGREGKGKRQGVGGFRLKIIQNVSYL
jgi:hypothetical protein